LDIRKGFLEYTKQIIKAIHTGRIEIRSAAALHSWARLHADLSGWIQKSTNPMVEIDARKVILSFIESLPSELKTSIEDYVAHQSGVLEKKSEGGLHQQID
jgi:hypothetical protein